MSTSHDGRRSRGVERKAAIIDATLTVIERDGVAGVTHRTVASETDVQPSLVAYYFTTLDDMLVAALSAAAEDYAIQFNLLCKEGVDKLEAIARMIADAGNAGRRRALAERELTLLAARRPALRPVASHWRTLVANAARTYTKDPLVIDAIVAIADGLCAKILLNDSESMSADDILNLLQHALYLDS